MVNFKYIVFYVLLILEIDKAVFAQAPCFATPATNFAVQQFPQSIIASDFNNDGKKDFAVTNYNTGSISIRLGNGLGGFAGSNFSFSAPNDLTAADFDNDGNMDLAIIRDISNNVLIYTGNGLGGFSAVLSLTVGANPFAITSSDFNNDGNKDLAIVSAPASTGSLSVLLGQGTGSFNAANNYSLSAGPSAVEAADFNNDGKTDILVAINFGSSIVLFPNLVSGIFGTPSSFIVGSSPFDIAVNDFNLDGKKDVALTRPASNNVYLMHGNGAFNFSSPVSYSAGTFPLGITTGDYNNDGFPDVATANYNGNNVSVLLGNGTGFLTPLVYSVGTNPFILTTADFNNDGALDLASANEGSNNVSVLMNSTAAITASGPTTFCSGNSVVLRGTKGASVYNWQPGGSTIDSLVVTTGGTYTLSVSNGTCTSTATISVTVNICTGISEHEDRVVFDVYPNPCTEQIFLAFSFLSNVNSFIEIENLYGEKLAKVYYLNKKEVEINTSSLASGIYLLTVFDGDKIIGRKKVIKN